uniref:Uncharacterized protein n=1 Tax=Globodera rostochiensis TaxID=31243 RepID=A0A914GXJ1_GLORO
MLALKCTALKCAGTEVCVSEVWALKRSPPESDGEFCRDDLDRPKKSWIGQAEKPLVRNDKKTERVKAIGFGAAAAPCGLAGGGRLSPVRFHTRVQRPRQRSNQRLRGDGGQLPAGGGRQVPTARAELVSASEGFEFDTPAALVAPHDAEEDDGWQTASEGSTLLTHKPAHILKQSSDCGVRQNAEIRRKVEHIDRCWTATSASSYGDTTASVGMLIAGRGPMLSGVQGQGHAEARRRCLEFENG